MALRDAVLRSSRGERQFRWRGRDVTRLENLSDIVFALSFTLIAASTVPATFDELASLWRDAIASGLCFALILMIWRSHYVYFRRYDLEDGWTTALNAALLFLVLIFTYPLKFLATFLVTLYTAGYADVGAISEVVTLDQAPVLGAIYAGGYVGVYAVLGFMFRRAGALADSLDLNEAERLLTRIAVRRSVGHVAVGLVVVAVSLQPLVHWLAVLAGALFMLLWPVQAYIAADLERRLKRLDGQT